MTNLTMVRLDPGHAGISWGWEGAPMMEFNAQKYQKRHGVQTGHSSLCRALHLMMTYDQLNFPSLASTEALNRRRRALIEHAHPRRPKWLRSFLEWAPDQADGSLVDFFVLGYAFQNGAIPLFCGIKHHR